MTDTAQACMDAGIGEDVAALLEESLQQNDSLERTVVKFLNKLKIFFGKIYLPITALLDGALLIRGFSITSSIK